MGEERASKSNTASYLENVPGVATSLGETHPIILSAQSLAFGRWENRLPQSYEGPEFDELKRAIAQAGGNTQAVMVTAAVPKLTAAESATQFEVVAGHRRVQACRQLGLPVRAVVLPNLDEQALFALVYHENSSREALRPYELGRMCASALTNGMFPSLRRVCAYLQLDYTSASRAVRLFELPESLHELIRTPLQWQLKDVDRLTKHIAKQDFPRRVEELKRVHGVMDRAPLLRALADVGSTNNELELEIIDGCEPGGCLFLSAKGKVRLVLDRALTTEQAKTLRSEIEGLLASWPR